MNDAHVENKKYPRGDLRFSTWIFEKGGNRTNFPVKMCKWGLEVRGIGVNRNNRRDRSDRGDTTACGRTNHSPQSEGLRPERLGVGVSCEVSDLPIVGGRTGAVTISCV